MMRPRMIKRPTKPPARQQGKRPHPEAAPLPKPKKAKRRAIPLQPLSERGQQWLRDVKAEVGSLKHSLADHFVSLERALRIEETLEAQLEQAVFLEDDSGVMRANPIIGKLRSISQLKRDILRDLSLADVKITGSQHWSQRQERFDGFDQADDDDAPSASFADLQ